MCFVDTRDVTETNNAFLFTIKSRSATSIFTHVDDKICEGDELYMATFSLESNARSGFRTRKAQPYITYIAIEDDDSKHLYIIFCTNSLIVCTILCLLHNITVTYFFHSTIIIIDMQLKSNVYSDVKYLTANVGNRNILIHIAFNITGTLINFNQSSYCVTERDGHIDISVTSTGAFLGLINVNVSCFGGTATGMSHLFAFIWTTHH